MKNPTRAALLAALAPAATLALAGTAAADPTPSWNCRASAVYTLDPLLGRTEPLVANGSATAPIDEPFCVNATAQTPTVAAGLATAKTPTAITAAQPADAAPRDQAVGGDVSIADVTTGLGGLGVEAKAISSLSFAQCVGGSPRLAAQSTIGSLTVNGQPINLDAPVTNISTVVDGSPVAGVLEIRPNLMIGAGSAGGDGQTVGVRALQLDLLSALGATPLQTTVIGETEVTRNYATCAAAEDGGTTGSSGASGTTGGGGGAGAGTGGNAVGPAVPTGAGAAGSTTIVNGSSTGAAQEIQLNGKNGGCGILKMRWVRSKTKTLNGKFGTRYVTRGKLVNCKRTASIVGARIDVYHVVHGSTKKLVKTGIKSRAKGALTLILPINLTQRKVIFEYRGNLKSARVSSRQILQFNPHDKTGKVVTSLKAVKKK